MGESALGGGRDLLDQILEESEAQGHDDYLLRVNLIVGVSGGTDSLALLHMLLRLRGLRARYSLHVAHLNHWARGKEAAEDAEFVRATCEEWDLPCTIEQFDVPNYARRARLSLEEAARRARYAFFASLAARHSSAVAVAHNADDQVETVLLNLLRGAGTNGIGGMRAFDRMYIPSRDDDLAAWVQYEPDAQVTLYRPLLSVWRHALVRYCAEAGLEPRHDTTNWERTFKRNRVRHDLIPTLQLQYSLAVKEHIVNLATIARDEDRLLDLLAAQEWGRHAHQAREGVCFDPEAFAAISPALQRRLVRLAFERLAGTRRDISFQHVEQVAAVLAAREGSPAAIHLPHGLQARREGRFACISFQTRMAALEALEENDIAERPQVPAGWTHPFVPEGSFLVGGWRLEASVLLTHFPQARKVAEDPMASVFDLDAVLALGEPQWRTRRGGDLMRPFGMNGSKSLQDLMVDAKIPRDQRDRVPLLALEGGGVLWVPGKGGRRSSAAPLADSTERALILRWVRV